MLSDGEIVFQSRRGDLCREYRLVLESAGIASEAVHLGGNWNLVVSAEDRDRAIDELHGYQEDNVVETPRELSRVRVFGGAIAGAVVYAVVIVSFAIQAGPAESDSSWHLIGSMRAGDVMAGQWWRVVTALTLHVDAAHVLSNLGFGCVFGFLAGRILGGGVAWLSIVVAGAAGNALNAMLRDADHVSIGASTAVFAMLGMMVSHALRPRDRQSQTSLQRWSPLIGGVLMLSLTGTAGERTDVAAHVTGFVAGMVTGWAVARLPDGWLANGRFQLAAGVVAMGIVVVAWAAAIASV
ncbi:rhomboid family intramembrane serine protease [Stieleria varia]|uniref:Rhomboid family protein n=1 Tax=Stieleria varia TaxID=2528005 RepID=A0A5C6B2T4_9BACT|nr:rhomboid family intramembrane serine protease [Stieleria varia]TWU06423.1 Rhomboid family protein [Stieleria varia]